MSKATVLNEKRMMGNSVQAQLLNTKILTSGAKYQRPVDDAKVSRIVSNFNEHKVNPIQVSYRDNKYWVYNGQHTLSALRAINGGDCMAWCEVHFGLTYEDEARLFAEQYDTTTKVTLSYKLQALMEAGDEQVCQMVSDVESLGLEVAFNGGKGKDKIVAVGELKKIYTTMGSNGLKKILLIIKEAWDGDSSSFDRDILGGIMLFIKHYDGEYIEDILIKNLSRFIPLEIKRKGRSDHSAKGNIRFAKQILDCYNFKLRKQNRLEYKFKG